MALDGGETIFLCVRLMTNGVSSDMLAQVTRLRFPLFLTLPALFTAGVAQAEQGATRIGPVPAWVRASDPLSVPLNAPGALFFRRQDVLVHLNSTGAQQYVGYRMKVLQSNALQVGNIAVSWNPAAGEPIIHGIIVYRGEQIIDVLKTTSFEILRREDQLEAAMIDGVLTATLRVPDLRVGDELEVSYTLPASDPTLGINDAGILLLGPSPAPGRYHMGLSWDDGRKPIVKLTSDMNRAAQISERAVDLLFENPTTLVPPKDAPPRFQWQRALEYSSYSDWAGVSRHLFPLFAKASHLSAESPVKREAKKITASNKGVLGRVSAALKLVQQDVRYVYVGLGSGNLTPATADETWRRRYGDCKGKTVLLLALLREMGIEGVPVLVSNAGVDDGMDQRLPSPRLYDHVLVRVRIDGAWYWLDGTMPPVVGPSTESMLRYRWILPLTAEGSSLEPVAWRPPTRPEEITLTNIDARAGFDQDAHVVNTKIVRGIGAVQQQISFSSVPPDQLVQAIRQNLLGGDWQTIDDVRWLYDEKAQASVLTISGTWKIDWEDDGDGAKSLALPGGGFNPPERRGRAKDQDQEAPYYNKPEFDCYVTTVRLPAATRSRQWASKPGYDQRIFGRNYYRAFGLRDGAIRMIRGFRVEQEEVDAAAALRDNGRIAKFDNSKGYIFYSPLTQSKPVATDVNVPATDEIDWTADNVPCVSSSARNKAPE
ncbi:MAG: DUF3857 domain-containing transglutaminase family protein [Pseudomonadota bacterium]|uniref:DUF3857 domain-containing transglutaminase family protein n=1 Tax=Rhizorhabdus phycosphaerae TaxID=2711156 RepID=UPI001D006639|nr:DUF3857 domain-containing transglutaminase family protein [Rhizorhabdus phycosphaerae]